MPCRIEQAHAAAAGDGHERIGVGGVAIRLRRFQVHPSKRTNDFEMAEFLGADVHEQVFAAGVVAVEPLNGVLHRGGQLAIGAAELLQEHSAEGWLRFANSHGVH